MQSIENANQKYPSKVEVLHKDSIGLDENNLGVSNNEGLRGTNLSNISDFPSGIKKIDDAPSKLKLKVGKSGLP